LGIIDIIGPTMIGPSSSHTAGAARLGRFARLILGQKPQRVDIVLRGSFAHTGTGHGTDLALIAGCLGLLPDDPGIVKADQLAEENGLVYSITAQDEYRYHPNEADLLIEGKDEKIKIVGTSVGGGRIRIRELAAYKIDLSGDYPTLLASYRDRPGVVAKVTALLAEEKINIAQMNVARERRGGGALLVAEMDSTVSEELARRLAADLDWVRIIPALED
jgi:L-serine dehydratase